MAVVLFPLRLAVVAAGILALVAGAVVLSTSPARSQNRRLAALIFAEALAITAGEGLMYMLDVPAHVAWVQGAALFVLLAAPWIQLRFYATLGAPLTRWLARPWIDRGLLALALLAPLSILVAPGLFLGPTVAAPYAQAVWTVEIGPLAAILFLGYGVALLYGFVCALMYHRRAPADLRPQARAFLLAFGIRDVLFVASLLVFFPLGFFVLSSVAAMFGLVAFVAFLGYGVAKAQLFDIDLKLKWTLKQGSVAAVFAAVFFVASEIIERMLDVNGAFGGIAAAGGVALALKPLERAAGKLADRAMPRVQATPEYVGLRKLEVYGAAVESANLDGILTTKDETLLARLREQLGIEPRAAADIEHRVLGRTLALP